MCNIDLNARSVSFLPNASAGGNDSYTGGYDPSGSSQLSWLQRVVPESVIRRFACGTAQVGDASGVAQKSEGNISLSKIGHLNLYEFIRGYSWILFGDFLKSFPFRTLLQVYRTP